MYKVFVLVATIVFSFSAFAGPEEHKDAQTCFYALENVKGAPSKVCIETVTVDLHDKSIRVYSYFNPKMTDGFELVALSRKNEDLIRFRAVNQILPGKALLLTGLANNWGQASFHYLALNLVDTENGNTIITNFVQE